jgi:hypothetical protein
MNCGANLMVNEPVVLAKEESRKKLSIETIRTIISIFGLLILNWLIKSMGFMKDLQIQESNLTAEIVVKSVVYLLIIFLLIRYASYIGSLWKKAFPKFSQADVFFQTILFLICLSVLYEATPWLFQLYLTDPQINLIYRLTLGGIAIVLIVRASIYFYQVLPVWLKRINLKIDIPEEYEEDKF